MLTNSVSKFILSNCGVVGGLGGGRAKLNVLQIVQSAFVRWLCSSFNFAKRWLSSVFCLNAES
jgi:hypothetical protein